MTTAVFARAGRMADQVREEARQLDPAKVVLTLLMIVPFIAGWLVGQVFRIIWTLVAWTWTAAVVGFRAAQGGGKGSPG